MVQLGGLVPGYPKEVPLRLRLVSLFFSLKVLLKLKIRDCDQNGDRVSKYDVSCHICTR